MKVLKRVPWAYKFTCKGCKSELVAEANDVKVTNFEEDNYHYVECPGCGTQHKFMNAWKTLPPKVINGAYERKRR